MMHFIDWMRFNQFQILLKNNHLKMKKYDFIFTITKKCNYQCSYCNFKKNKNELQGDDVGGIIDFLNTNHEKIHSFKFF